MEPPPLPDFPRLTKRQKWGLAALAAVGTWDHCTREHDPYVQQAAFFVTLLVSIILIVVAELLRPKPDIEDARPKGLGDFKFPTATEGRVVPLVFGRVRIDGPNVVWYGDLLQEAITERIKTGLFSSENVTKGFRYYLGVQFALCRGGGDGCKLKRLWIKDTLVFDGNLATDGSRTDIDKPALMGGEETGSGGIQSTIDFYTGSGTQAVNAYLDDPDRQRVAAAATATAPAYRGTCYIVARQMTGAAPTAADEGAYLGTSTSIPRWSFEIERLPSLFSGQGAGENTIGTGGDANPINVLYELLTNDEWGFGFPAADIDVGLGSSFLSAADTMITESAGMSLLLERPMRAQQLMEEIQRHIDGVVFLDQTTGKWTVKLARDDYDINTVPQLTDDNTLSISEYTRGSWEDTTNQIQVQYFNRDDEYKESYAIAQDMANAIIRGDQTVSGSRVSAAQVVFPGVKNGALASNFAWRELRALTYPAARAKVTANRDMYDVTVGDVIAWTSTALGFTKLPMRVVSVDFGKLEANQIGLELFQDVFQFAAASFGDAPSSGWTPPSASLAAYPSDEQAVFEAPRAIITRDPNYAGDPSACKVMASARRQGNEVGFNITERNAAGTPAGTFAEAGTVYQFQRIGSLDSALSAGVANPTSTITINPSPDNQTNLEAAFGDSTTLQDMGMDLVHLILVGSEFMLVRTAANNGADVDLQTVYRGVLDSAQQDHSAGADVFLVFLGAGVSDTNLPNTNNVDVRLVPFTYSTTFAGTPTTVALAMNKRATRPYPVGAIRVNGTTTDFGTPDVEGDGSGSNGAGFNVGWLRRRVDATDEVVAVVGDADPDLVPGVANTEYRVRVFVDPSGSNDEIDASPTAWASGVGPVLVNRLELWNYAAAGTEIRVEVEARHDFDGDTQLVSLADTYYDVTPTSARDGDFYLGGNLRAGDVSNSYVAAATGTFVVNIGAAYSSSNVQYRLNGGAWTTVVSAGGTTGNIVGVAASDTIELRHTTNEAPSPQYVELENPSAVVVAYGVFSN